MLSDPLQHPLLAGTALRAGGLLLLALLALLVVERRHVRELGRRPLFQRWRTWAIIAPVYAAAILAGSATTAALAFALSVQGLREYASLVELPPGYRRVLICLGALAAPAALVSIDLFHALPPLLLVIATLQPLLMQGTRSGVRNLAFAVLGWAYLAWLLAFTVVVHRTVPGGDGLLLTLGLAVALSDVGAFAVGSSIGRHPMAPRLSPNKTWEGFGGNVLGALAGMALMHFAWPPHLAWPFGLALGVLVAVGSAWGDLVESSLKREFGAKDAGAWLPGFGGLLDRIDSFVIVVPLVYYALRIAGLA